MIEWLNEWTHTRALTHTHTHTQWHTHTGMREQSSKVDGRGDHTERYKGVNFPKHWTEAFVITPRLFPFDRWLSTLRATIIIVTMLSPRVHSSVQNRSGMQESIRISYCGMPMTRANFSKTMTKKLGLSTITRWVTSAFPSCSLLCRLQHDEDSADSLLHKGLGTVRSWGYQS
jgi:hypothetical protein